LKARRSAAAELHRRWAGDPEPVAVGCHECGPGLTCVACLMGRRADVEDEQGDDDLDAELEVLNAEREKADMLPGLGRVLVAVQKSLPIRRRPQ